MGTARAVWGDQVPIDVEVWNRKLLPLPLLTADDHVTDTLRVVGRPLVASERPGQGALQNSWSLLWYERVIRHLVIDARRRGAFTFGPVRLTVSDLFERGTNSEEPVTTTNRTSWATRQSRAASSGSASSRSARARADGG